MYSIEESVRLELIQLGGVLVLDRPKPGEELPSTIRSGTY